MNQDATSVGGLKALHDRLGTEINFLFPQILFALFLIPTKYAFLSEKFQFPAIINPQNLLMVFFGLIILIILFTGEKFTAVPKRLAFPFIGFLLILTISLYYTSSPGYGVTKVIEFFTVTSMACYAPFFLFRSIHSIERFLKTLVVVAIALGIFVFLSSPYSFQFYSAPNTYPEFQTTIGSNYLALQYVIGIAVLIIIYYLLFQERIYKKNRTLYLLLLGLLASALLYSPGKNPIISLFLTIVFMTVASLKFDHLKILIKKKILQFAFLMFVFGAILLSTIGWMFVLRFQAVLRPGYYGQVERIENANVALDLFMKHPLTGVGIGGFENYSREYASIEKMRYPHNIILEVGSELGVAGLLFFLLIIGFAFQKLFYLTRKYRHTSYYSLANLILSFLVFTFLTSLTGGNINNPLLFAWIGTAFVLEPLIKKSLENNSSLTTSAQ